MRIFDNVKNQFNKAVLATKLDLQMIDYGISVLPKPVSVPYNFSKDLYKNTSGLAKAAVVAGQFVGKAQIGAMVAREWEVAGVLLAFNLVAYGYAINNYLNNKKGGKNIKNIEQPQTDRTVDDSVSDTPERVDFVVMPVSQERSARVA